MRVICIEIVNPVTGEAQVKSPWVELDAEYEVLELYAHPDGRIDLRLVSGDSETPALFDSSMFMTSDGTLPANWEGRIGEGGVLRIGPKEWMQPGFWDAFFDRDPAALETYRRGRSGAG